ncbi:MAG: hypothetical protein H6742_07650 [Alphaproteobacteria bacterium]|nr:hypothetical protein [Alphaproteobacteria bacterium]
MLLLLLACAPDGGIAPTPDPDPWLDLAPVPLQVDRELLRTALPDAEAPTRLVSLPAAPLTAAFDPAAGVGWVLDGRYRHSPRTACVPTDLWPELDDGSRQGSCTVDQVEIHRGVLRGDAATVALAADPGDRAFLGLSADGVLWRAEADPLVGNPFDHLVPVPLATLDGVGAEGGLLASSGGGGVLAQGTRLRWLHPSGEVLAEAETAAPVQDIVWSFGNPYVLTTESLGRYGDGDIALDGAGGRMAADGEGGAWVTLPERGLLVRIDDVPSVVDQVEVEGLIGPVGAGGGVLVVATEEGLLFLEEGEEAHRTALPGIVDLVVQESGELAVLLDDGTVSVRVPEALQDDGRAPVSFTLTTYLENPKPTDSEPVCEEGEDSLRARFERAEANRQLLQDLPAEVALGIIPEVAEQAIACGRNPQLAKVWQGERISPGLFFYGEPESGTLEALEDWQAYATAQVSPLLLQGIPVRWYGGPERQIQWGGDWVRRVGTLGLAEDVLGIGLGVLPEIGSWDPRSKEAVPDDLRTPRTAWRPASTEDPLADGDSGLVIRPGVPTSFYTLGGCANAFIYECKQAGLGGGQVIDEQDLGVAELLLWRAVALRSEAGPDHIGFHLPALGLDDYTEGCIRDARVWHAVDAEAGCRAEVLQAWFFDLQARYVSAGLVQWWAPGSEQTR